MTDTEQLERIEQTQAEITRTIRVIARSIQSLDARIGRIERMMQELADDEHDQADWWQGDDDSEA